MALRWRAQGDTPVVGLGVEEVPTTCDTCVLPTPCPQYTIYAIPPNRFTDDHNDYNYWELYDLGSDQHELNNRCAFESALRSA